MKPWNKKVLQFSLATAAFLLLTGAVIAQVSTNYALRESLFSGGGGTRQSTTYQLQDSLGQMAIGNASSASNRVEAGFWAGAVGTPTPTPTGPPPTNTPTNTPTKTPTGPPPTNTPTNTPTKTPTSPPATNTPTPTQLPGDAYEADGTCAIAKTINTDGSTQSHTFHTNGDVDWIKFEAQANKTYVIQVENVGAKADAIVLLYDTCASPPGTFGDNAFGSTVVVEWDATKNGTYYLEIQQFDPSFFGSDANYRVSVIVDGTPPSKPMNPRCVTINQNTLALQWDRSPERDVRTYQVNFINQSGSQGGTDDVVGATTTYHELAGLIPNELYTLKARALDFSQNVSPWSGEATCRATAPSDTTQPVVTIAQPANTAIYTTTASLATFTGEATDSGNNLSRVQVRNTTKGVEGWDYTLSGNSDDFRVADVALNIGDNTIQITAYDDAGNSSQKSMLVRRLGDSPGAVIIVAGHNETFGLQTNIYNSTNRAYRIFQSAGYTDEDIYYIAPVAQDPDGDGVSEVDTAGAAPADVQYAIATWATEANRIGPGKPLFIYMMDHGLEEKFCVNGCNGGGAFSPEQMDEWLRTMETATGADEVNIVIEACRSGSFINRASTKDSITKLGRVVITSAGASTNAYASAQGAYFSDAFFSCIVDSNNLKQCYTEATQAVQAAGTLQTPWMDDNGDGVSNAGDGSIAELRRVTRFFSSVRPVIQSAVVDKQGVNGTLTAKVDEGAEALDVVWAAVYPPSFQEPSDVTINLNTPVVRLEADPGTPGRFTVNYPNGFTEAGDYRIIFYAQDRLGINAQPMQPGGGQHTIYLPMVIK